MTVFWCFVLYMECRPLPSLCHFANVGVLSTFSDISAAAAAGFARSSQLSSPYAGQAVRPAHHSTNHRFSSPLLQLGRAGRPFWVNSLRLQPLWLGANLCADPARISETGEKCSCLQTSELFCVSVSSHTWAYVIIKFYPFPRWITCEKYKQGPDGSVFLPNNWRLINPFSLAPLVPN